MRSHLWSTGPFVPQVPECQILVGLMVQGAAISGDAARRASHLILSTGANRGLGSRNGSSAFLSNKRKDSGLSDSTGV